MNINKIRIKKKFNLKKNVLLHIIFEVLEKMYYFVMLPKKMGV